MNEITEAQKTFNEELLKASNLNIVDVYKELAEKSPRGLEIKPWTTKRINVDFNITDMN